MGTFKLATYNIHKGVQGIGWTRRLEIHNIGLALAQLQADVVCLQEVRLFNRWLATRFQHWPEIGQAEFLKPQGYASVYRTNAVTRHGEHGNALLSRWPVHADRHSNMSDHRFEQRGLLHVTLQVHARELHVMVVHLGLLPGSRVRQVKQLLHEIALHVPQGAPLVVAGDFNDWGQTVTRMMLEAGFAHFGEAVMPTFPAQMPLAQLDHVYVRGLQVVHQVALSGHPWSRLSDHLPLVVELAWNAR
jgi:endonuclease/exonuclease/phosphatase family metal-dependent hydrolase